MTLRDVLGSNDEIDADPLGAAFMIAATLRSAAQGEPSTYEGECATLAKASEHFDLKSGDGIRVWLTRLGVIPDMDLPDSFWLSMAAAADSDELNDEQEKS